MTALAYATLDDLAQWVDDDLPVTSPSILRSAAYAVREYTAAALYTTDSTSGLPSDPTILAGFRDATCAQAAWMITNEVDAFSGGASAQIESDVSLGTAKIAYADAGTAAAKRAAALDGLCPDAARIIRSLGLRNAIFEAPAWRRGVIGDIY